MTLTLHWWMVVIVLIVVPLIYGTMRKQQSDWDFQVDTIFIAVLCWAFAIGLTIGRVF